MISLIPFLIIIVIFLFGSKGDKQGEVLLKSAKAQLKICDKLAELERNIHRLEDNIRLLQGLNNPELKDYIATLQRCYSKLVYTRQNFKLKIF